MVRSLIPFNLELGSLVERINRLMTDSTDSAVYATLVAGKLNPNGMVEISNAGHNPPIVVGKSGIKKFEATGLPVGLFHKGLYTTEKLLLEKDDLLFLYTDGVTETVNPAGEELGMNQRSDFESTF
jgi:serine phosphatase RsbU (regulator of sigma subunit)